MSRYTFNGRLAVAIGRAIRERKAAADLSISELARRTGMGPSQVSRWLCGEAAPAVETLCKIADALGCEPGDLLPPRSELAALKASAREPAAPPRTKGRSSDSRRQGPRA